MTSVSRARRMRVGVTLLALVTLVTGACAGFGKSFKEPVVTLKDVVITGLGATGGNLDVVLSVYNPNGYKLEAVGMTYQVDVETTKVGEGELGDRFVVQQGDSSEVRMPVRFTYAGLGVAGRSMITSGAVNYRVKGDLTVATPLGNYKRPYDRTGRYSSLGGKGH
ncbi:MAG TPA: LEA type 2 family protein [Casimicrobiaceae bacterium]|nr:LEA type 2 family protein [Casimicrobiaceae bacterium]